MKWLLTHRAWQDYQDAPASVQKAFDKQVGLLPENLRHPSLRAKKYDQANDIWQARVNRDWPILFSTAGRHLHDYLHYSSSQIVDPARRPTANVANERRNVCQPKLLA